MKQRQRLLALLEIYDNAIEELYVLGDPAFLDLILRLERRWSDAAAQLAAYDIDPRGMSPWVTEEIARRREDQPLRASAHR